jgi:hypothetical protein
MMYSRRELLEQATGSCCWRSSWSRLTEILIEEEADLLVEQMAEAAAYG